MISTLDKKKNIQKLVVAGLLHDLGKMYQRANNYKSWNNKFKYIKKKLLSNYKYQHGYITKWAIHEKAGMFEKWEPILEKISGDINTEDKKTSTFNLIDNAAQHHYDNAHGLTKYITVGDRLSSSERVGKIQEEIEKELGSEFKEYKCDTYRLASVFNYIKFEKESSEIKNFQYKISSFSTDANSNLFPKEYGPDSKNKEIVQEEYKKVVDAFEADIAILSGKVNNFSKANLDYIVNYLYYICQKHMLFIPSYTNGGVADISLFEHSRITAAIATCLYDKFPEEKENATIFRKKVMKNNDFLILSADISGIQSFIYNIAKDEGESEEGEKAKIAKSLRGRSTFLGLLSDFFARKILKELNYTISNILYSGGGGFQLLVANTEGNQKKINEVFIEIEKYLLNTYNGQLGISYAYTDATGEELLKKYGDVVKRVFSKLETKKKQRFKDTISWKIKEGGYVDRLLKTKKKQRFKDTISDWENNQNINGICPVCRAKLVESGKICENCKCMQNLGQWIVGDYKHYSFNFDSSSHGKQVKIGKLGSIEFFKDKVHNKDQYSEIFSLNDYNFYSDDIIEGQKNAVKFMGNITPKYSHKFAVIMSKQNNENINEGETIPFNHLVELAKGDKKLGVFRADVDNLGLVFGFGLKSVEHINIFKDNVEYGNMFSISRLSTLSKFLDIFFSYYTNIIAKQISKSDDIYGVEDVIYTVYSGGDDLFYIGPHNKIYEFAKKVREEFKRFTAHNSNITLSGGLAIAHNHLPIPNMADFAGQLEEVGKGGKKNGFGLFGKRLKWNEQSANVDMFDEEDKPLLTVDKFDKLCDVFYQSDISSGVMYKLLQLHNTFVDDNGNIQGKIYPKAYYMLARNIKNDNVKEGIIRTFFADGKDSKQNLYFLDAVIQQVLTNKRGEK